MTDVTDEQIFSAIRDKLAPQKLTQTTVDITNIATATPPGRTAIIKYLELDKMDSNITRPYNLTPETLRKVYPKANVAAIPIILKYAAMFGIVTKKQMCAFLATCILESSGFNAKRESFAYSAKRLTEVFPKKRIPDLAFAQSLVAKGQPAIANHLYNGRMGNRTGTNDGWNYRGNSWIQLTGRANHYEMQNITGIKVGDNPKLLEDLDIACQVTMKWWSLKGLNSQADLTNFYSNGYTLNTLNAKGVETKDYMMNTGARLVRYTVNGGYIGFKEFCEYYEACMRHM